MLRLIFIIAAIFIVISLIGTLTNKNNIELISDQVLKSATFLINTSTKNSEKFKELNIDKNLPNITSSVIYLDIKIEQEVSKLTKNIKPDNQKKIKEYINELSITQEKFLKILNFEQDLEKLDPTIFINLAEEFSKINPPEILYEFHLKIVKIYYSLGVSLDFYKKSKNPVEKIFIYNYIMQILNQLKSLEL